MRWEKAAQKEKERFRQGVGIVETRHTSKEIARKEKEKETGKEAEAKDIPKEVKDSKVAKVFQEPREKKKGGKGKGQPPRESWGGKGLGKFHVPWNYNSTGWGYQGICFKCNKLGH